MFRRQRRRECHIAVLLAAGALLAPASAFAQESRARGAGDGSEEITIPAMRQSIVRDTK